MFFILVVMLLIAVFTDHSHVELVNNKYAESQLQIKSQTTNDVLSDNIRIN